MKRVLRIALILIALVILTAVGAVASAFIGRSAIQPCLVDGFIHVVQDGFVTANILDIGDGKVALIDAGTDPSGKAILAELSAMHLDAGAVTVIFLTHGHKDHVAAAPLFPQAKVYALAPDVALAQGQEGGHGLISRFMPVKPTGVHVSRALTDGEIVQAGRRAVHVLAIPGHTAGSAAYWVEGALFLGDSAGATSDGKLAAAPYVFSDDPEQNRASLKALAARLVTEHLDVKTLLFAHTGRLETIKPLAEFAAPPHAESAPAGK